MTISDLNSVEVLNSTSKGQLYIFDEIDPRGQISNYIKIGKINPNNSGRSSLDRMKEHQGANPRLLQERYVLSTLADISKLESTLHNSFSTKRVRDEWFITDGGNIDPFVEKAKEINTSLEQQIPLILSSNELDSKEDNGEEKKSCSESEDLHNLLKQEDLILNDLKQSKNLIDYKLRHLGGDVLTGIDGVSSFKFTAPSTRFDEKRFIEEKEDLALLIGNYKISGTFSIRKKPKKIKNNELEILKDSYETKRKLSKSFHIMDRNEASEALHLDWLEIHRKIQPHEIQKKYFLLRLKSLTGEFSGIENICSWKRRKKLKVSRTDVESYNPDLASNYLVKSQPSLRFYLNDFRPYNF